MLLNHIIYFHAEIIHNTVDVYYYEYICIRYRQLQWRILKDFSEVSKICAD